MKHKEKEEATKLYQESYQPKHVTRTTHTDDHLETSQDLTEEENRHEYTKFVYLMNKKSKKEYFGQCFIEHPKDLHYHSKYEALCKTSCHVIVFTKRSMEKIKERIMKK